MTKPTAVGAPLHRYGEAHGENPRHHPSARAVAGICHRQTNRSAGTESATLKSAGRCAVVAIGASTGGPGAILEILRGLPVEFRLPILLVLHINEPFGTAFADWLDAQTSRPVAYARDGMPVTAAVGRVVVAPAGLHMVVA